MKEEEEREHGEIKDRREMRREEKINKVLKIAFFIYHYTIEYIQNTKHNPSQNHPYQLRQSNR